MACLPACLPALRGVGVMGRHLVTQPARTVLSTALLLAFSGNVFAADIINQTVTGHTSAALYGEYGGVVPYQSNFVGNIDNSTFTNNKVDTTGQLFSGATYPGGGAIGVASFTGNITNSLFRNNTVITEIANTPSGVVLQPLGGALSVRGKFTGDIINTTFENNLLTGAKRNHSHSGAMHLGRFEGTIRDSLFANNKSSYTYDASVGYQSVSGAGGAFDIWGMENSVIDNTEFRDNGSLEFGGAMRILDAANSQINNSRFFNNLGTLGGAVLLGGGAVNNLGIALNDNTFIGNTVSGRRLFNNQYHSQSLGAAIAVINAIGNQVFNNNIFLANRAINESGLLWFNFRRQSIREICPQEISACLPPHPRKQASTAVVLTMT